VQIEPGQRIELVVALKAEPKPVATAASQPAVADAPAQVDPKGLSSFGAQTVAPRFFTADVSGGFPYLVGARLTTGIFDRGHWALDVGVDLRSYGVITDIALTGKLRVYSGEPLSVALMLSGGGGGGPKSCNTFFLNAGALASINFKRLVTFTARVYGNFYSDRHCPAKQEGDELTICASTAEDLRGRRTGARLMLSAVLEVPITRHIGLFALFEGAPFQAHRRAYTDDVASLMPNGDPRAYGRLGASFKF